MYRHRTQQVFYLLYYFWLLLSKVAEQHAAVIDAAQLDSEMIRNQDVHRVNWVSIDEVY